MSYAVPSKLTMCNSMVSRQDMLVIYCVELGVLHRFRPVLCATQLFVLVGVPG